jgi:uncharacterized C2H2 Zn-finger protein
MKVLKTIAAKKRALLKREQELINRLNVALPRIGYQIVLVTNGAPSNRRRQRATDAARPKPLACPHCTRTFRLKLHLGRHINATHKRKAAPQRQPETITLRPRRRMSPAARRAAARRMKAYWRKRKAAERSPSRSAARSSRTRARPGRARRAKAVPRSPRRAA